MLTDMMLLQMAMFIMAPAIFALAGVTEGQGTESPVAKTRQGVMRGVTMTTRLGRNFYAFRGIPYAAPPVGNLRFQAPVAAGPWQGVLDATKDAPECIQKNYLIVNANVTGQEDCLYLNVYTPKMSPPYGLLPVMIYIHGGGFFSGTGASYIVGPEFLLDKDVVLVTFNYRVGAMGFFSTGTDAAPGNAGMKDQVEAIKWVNANIAVFGGDPECITLFGQSAGAVSVHYHILSPLSHGLFQRAITQSGTALNAWALPMDPKPIAEKQAAFINCPTTTPEEMVACLQSVDATKLVDSGDNFHLWSIDPLTTYRPVVEYGMNAFLPDHPAVLISKGAFANVPWINGVVADEGIIRAVPILTNETLLTDLNSRPQELIPFLMELPSSAKSSEDIPEILKKISNFYFGTDVPVINEDNYKKFIDLYSDRSTLQGFYKSAVLHSQAGHENHYLYNFAYRGKYSFSAVFAPTTKDYGVSHCDELIYLFSTPILFPGWEEGHPDLQVIDNLGTLWTNFARNGKPASEAADTTHSEQLQDNSDSDSCTGPQDIQWDCYEPTRCTGSADRELKFLNITAAPSGSSNTLKFCMQTGFLPERLAFWESLPLKENENPSNIFYFPSVNQLFYYLY